MEEKKWEIGKEYEFSFNEEEWFKYKLLYIKDQNEHKYITIDNYGDIYFPSYIREIEPESIEPRFIETDIYNEGSGDIDVYTTRHNGTNILLSNVINRNAIGFKFEGSNDIFNVPIVYYAPNSSTYHSILNANYIEVCEILRANKVVWLNPKYKE